ncbi:hypothetical protein SEA_JUJU_46 [Gordonia phage JuJu]|uniref:Uncharacterized protein n=1 Tax=Gordonia phage JuJu TaxID=2590929 RepID=A0A516KR45_9CAUD|nr:hypothetical protein KNU69_gp46 [Gordonia phage JuJu]QDP44162.1 hypothetical protein SEA_JUJU_46 [Gordonia phage JuJu]
MYRSATERALDGGGFDIKAVTEMADDLAAVRADDPQAWSDMRQTLLRAQQGTCRRKQSGGVDPDGDWDAPMTSSALDIGELRRDITIDGRLYRLYVHAPPMQPGVLLLLHFAWKPPGDATTTQNEQIEEAEERLARWQSEQVK